MGSHDVAQGQGSRGKLGGWVRGPAGLVALAIVVLAAGIAVGVSFLGPEADTQMPLAVYDDQIRTEKLEGVVVFPWIFNARTPVPAGGRDCEPMQLAPLGNHSGIFVSDENGQIIQRSTIGDGVGTFSSTGSGSCEIRFRLDVPMRDRYRVTAGYIAGAPPSYSVVVASGERARIEIPAP